MLVAIWRGQRRIESARSCRAAFRRIARNLLESEVPANYASRQPKLDVERSLVRVHAESDGYSFVLGSRSNELAIHG